MQAERILTVTALALVCLLVLVLSWWGTARYLPFAVARTIVAQKNARTLHETVVPRGGGIVFASVFVLAVAMAWTSGRLPTWMTVAFGAVGMAAAIAGWRDDIRELPQVVKLASHLALSVAGLIILQTAGVAAAGSLAGLMGWPMYAVLLFVPVWFVNMYNFVDGIDGMAAGGAVFICGAVGLVLWLTGGNEPLVWITALLGSAVSGFLVWNAPPARVFMGDSGTTFFGWALAMLLLITVLTGQISGWTWLVILSYYLADTSTTTTCRVVLVKRWWAGHRSHAYQNLARVGRSHGRVTYGVALYNVLWVLPWTVVSVWHPTWAPLAAAATVVPAVGWALRFGPLFSRE